MIAQKPPVVNAQPFSKTMLMYTNPIENLFILNSFKIPQDIEELCPSHTKYECNKVNWQRMLLVRYCGNTHKTQAGKKALPQLVCNHNVSKKQK